MVVAVEDDFVVAHGGTANHRAVVLVVKDPQTPDATAKLVCVLIWSEGHADAVAEGERHHVEGQDVRVRRRVAVVVGVLASCLAAGAGSPRAMVEEVVTHGPVCLGWEVHEGRTGVDDCRAVGAAGRIDGHALDLDGVQRHRVGAVARRGDPVGVQV